MNRYRLTMTQGCQIVVVSGKNLVTFSQMLLRSEHVICERVSGQKVLIVSDHVVTVSPEE